MNLVFARVEALSDVRILSDSEAGAQDDGIRAFSATSGFLNFRFLLWRAPPGHGVGAVAGVERADYGKGVEVDNVDPVGVFAADKRPASVRRD